ncbi:hypothetical protein [Streptomyces sp. NPDC053048]|uniref:hypothetical protein n=1 Tax=Streptomyces sp. NPDC053048 TaxID=3365694 RepID=UPI0037D04825
MIDQMLRGAQLRVPVYTSKERAGDERRLFQRIDELEQRRAQAAPAKSGWLVPTSPELAALFSPGAGSGACPPGPRVRRDLNALCLHVLGATGARVADFLETDQPVDGVGARGLGCATYLSGGDEGARFWWRFAAGTGDATAAYLLWLEALLRGEPGEALHCFQVLHGSDFLADEDWETAHSTPPQQTPRSGDRCFHERDTASPPPIDAGLIRLPHRASEAQCSYSPWDTPSPC